MKNIKLIAFDADDTLWVNEPHFRSAEARFSLILEKYLGKRDFTKELYENEIKNLNLFGYGAKGFMLSMIESALELTNYQMAGEDIQKIINMGKEILSYKIDLYEGIVEALKFLSTKDVAVICITKGDLLDQESKVARSGLGDYFKRVHVVNEKNPETYEKIIKEYAVTPSEFAMIGNSLKSDILPVLSLGATAYYIPCETPWVHEVVNVSSFGGKAIKEYKKIAEIIEDLKLTLV